MREKNRKYIFRDILFLDLFGLYIYNWVTGWAKFYL